MRRLVLLLSGVAVALIIAVGAVAAVLLIGGGGGVDEEAYRREVRPLILAWQGQMALDSFECEQDEEDDDDFTAEDVEFFKGSVSALKDIHGDVQAIEAPGRYKSGVEAMGAVTEELEGIEDDFGRMLALLEEVEALPLEDLLAGVEPTPENVRWFVRVGGAFEAWGNDFERWSDFIDCTLPEAPERVGELGGHIRQVEIDLAELQDLRQEGPPGLVRRWAPIFDMAEVATQVFARLSRALESQVEVERAFADVIEGQ